LQRVKEITGHTPDELLPIQVSEVIMYLWEWFLQLNAARQNNGMAISPISYSEIQAWVQLMQVTISPFEITVIKALDNLFIRHVNNSSKESK
jgi:hypothetical protein